MDDDPLAEWREALVVTDRLDEPALVQDPDLDEREFVLAVAAYPGEALRTRARHAAGPSVERE